MRPPYYPLLEERAILELIEAREWGISTSAGLNQSVASAPGSTVIASRIFFVGTICFSSEENSLKAETRASREVCSALSRTMVAPQEGACQVRSGVASVVMAGLVCAREVTYYEYVLDTH